MAAEKHPCAGHVFNGRLDYPCSRSGTVEEDGRWWCRQHAPSAEAARRAKSKDRYRQERAERDAADERARVLGERAGCHLTNARTYSQPLTPTDRVEIAEADLDRILKEAGR